MCQIFLNIYKQIQLEFKDYQKYHVWKTVSKYKK